MIYKNKTIAYQTIVIDKDNMSYIFMMETKPEYRRKGIADNLLTDLEKILFEKLNVNSLKSTATNYSKDLFIKHGYEIKPYTTPRFIAGDLNPSNIQITLTKENYNKKVQKR